MDIKKFIASHIEDEVKREQYLSGIPGQYKVSKLDFKDISVRSEEKKNYICTFDDTQNNYVFEECTLNNIEVNFENGFIGFDRCSFEGKGAISNIGIGEDDLIVVRYTKPNNELHTLSVRSSSVELSDNVLFCRDNLSVSAADLTIINNKILAPTVDIKYLYSCSIIDSLIKNTNGISNESIYIENSTINDKYLDGIDTQPENENSKTL